MHLCASVAPSLRAAVGAGSTAVKAMAVDGRARPRCALLSCRVRRCEMRGRWRVASKCGQRSAARCDECPSWLPTALRPTWSCTPRQWKSSALTLTSRSSGSGRFTSCTTLSAFGTATRAPLADFGESGILAAHTRGSFCYPAAKICLPQDPALCVALAQAADLRAPRVAVVDMPEDPAALAGRRAAAFSGARYRGICPCS